MTYSHYRLASGILGAALMLTACTTKKQETPSLTGPSELGTAIAIAASPDVLAQDGASQSLITITAHDSNGQILRNLSLRAEIAVDGSITDFGSLSARNIVTDATGRAFVTYTAPPTPPIFVDAGTIVQIRALPAGTNFDNATSRFASIRLVPPGVIGAPPSPFRPEFQAPTATVGDATVFSATVIDANSNDVTNQIASYFWNFGDGDTGTGRNVSHTFDDSGSLSVSLTIVDALGRRATVAHAVNVLPGNDPSPNIQVTPGSPTRGQTVTFNGSLSTATPGHRITNFSWDFGDGSGAGGPIVTHAYGADGSYSVTLTVTDDAGRQKAAVQAVTVGVGAPTAAFTSSPSTPQTNQNVSFNASASTASAGRSIVSYAWDFDDGATAGGVTTSHTYTLARSYNVTLTVTDSAGQTGTVSHSVTVGSGNPTAAFNFSPSSPLTGTVVSFDASSSTPGVGRAIVVYRWNFDDGSAVVNGGTPTTTHTFNVGGTYQVLLTVIDDAGQIGQITRAVTVGSGSPTSSFTFSPTSPATNQAVLFDGRSSAGVGGRTITTYAWAFGDGGTGTGATPTHTYTTSGTYVVRLTVTDNTGQTGTSTQSITVTSDPVASFTFSPPGAAPAFVSFDSSTSSVGPGRTITGYAWNFGDPASVSNTSTFQNPNHTFALTGSYTVTLTITDSAGRTNSTTRTVNVP